jgi:hypothetical protein
VVTQPHHQQMQALEAQVVVLMVVRKRMEVMRRPIPEGAAVVADLLARRLFLTQAAPAAPA